MAEIGTKKHHHVGLWITFILIFVLIILPVGLTFAFFFDPTHTSEEELGIKTSGERRKFTDNLVVDLFDYTDNAEMDNSLSISIKEQEINQMLYDNLLSVMDENTKTVMPQAYLQIGKEDYTFVVELNAYGFFKSRIFLVTSLEITDNPKGLMFELKDLKIARLGGIHKIALGILKNFIDDAQIASTISSSMPLTIESHLFDGNGKSYLFYPHENFIKDMNKMISLDEGTSFFEDFIKQMIADERFKFDFYSDKGIHGLMPLKEFHDNTTYGSYNDYVIDFKMKEELNRYLPSLIKDGNVNNSNIDTVAKYLSYGYTVLTDSEKTVIDNASYLPTALGKSVSEYSAERETKFASRGSDLSEVKSVKDVVKDQVSEALTPSKMAEILLNKGGKIVDARINEIDLHDCLKTNEAIGYGHVFYRPTDEGGYKISFISVDNLYVNIVNNNMYFIVGININGYEVSMILTTIIESAGSGKIYFSLDGDNAYFGNYKLPSALFNSFSSLLSNAVGDEGWIAYDGTNNRFVFDFEDYINDNAEIQALKLAGLDINAAISAKGSSISDNGYLNIAVSASEKK